MGNYQNDVVITIISNETLCADEKPVNSSTPVKPNIDAGCGDVDIQMVGSAGLQFLPQDFEDTFTLSMTMNTCSGILYFIFLVKTYHDLNFFYQIHSAPVLFLRGALRGGIFDFEGACAFFDLIGSRYNVFYMVSLLHIFLLDHYNKFSLIMIWFRDKK